MRLNPTYRLPCAISRNSRCFIQALVPVLIFGLLVGTNARAQVPAATASGNGQRTADQATQSTATAAQTAEQDTAPDVEPVSRQRLPQDPLRIAINNAVQKGMQDAKLNTAATQAGQVTTGGAAQASSQNAAPNASSNAPQNGSSIATQNTSPGAAQSGSPAANTAPNPNQSAIAPTGAVPPRIQDGIAALVNAEASLEKAGNKWGGHKQTAIKLIDQALTACGQTPTSESGGSQSAAADESAAMQSALTQLTTAQNDFQNAKNPWGGRRDQALALINQALSEVQAGISFAKSHNTY